MYLMICTRPDIAFAVSMVSRFQSNPGKLHWMAIQWIFRYLKRTKGRKLTYHGSNNLKLSGFSDSDYQGCLVVESLPLVLYLCYVVELLHGKVRNKNVLLNLRWKLNI